MHEKSVIAVTGASGLLGRPLVDILKADGRFQPRGTAWNRVSEGLDKVDITDRAAVEKWLDSIKPAVVIHLAAERRPDVYAADPEGSDRLNIDATKDLASSCAQREIKLLFLSTNYVFDGVSAPYSPNDKTNPLNGYGWGKLAGEQAVLSASNKNIVLRVPMFHGPSTFLEESSVTILLKAFLESEKPVLLDTYQTRYPAFTLDIATLILGLLPGLIAGSLPSNIFHFCPSEAFTKKEMGEIMASIVGEDIHRAIPDGKQSGTVRPKNVQLLCPNIEALGLMKVTPFRKAIQISLDSIKESGGFNV